MFVNDFAARDNLAAIPFPEVTVVLVTSPEHALASREEPWTRAELQSHVELSVHDSSESERADPTMFGGSRVFFLSDFATKRQALLSGLGFGWAPLYLIASDLEQGRLVEVPYERGSRYSFQPMLVYRVDRPMGRAGRRFVELLRP
ncbi:MAG: LysR substrate-binding domain-containing protein [bacterium]